MKKIKNIVIKKIVDDNPDLSYLGEFSDEAGKFAVTHGAGLSENAYKYFNAANVENMKQARQNYNRVMEYCNGNLCDYGMKAEAIIHTSNDGVNWLINTITSGGLWGLSNDGSEEDFEGVANDQVEELKETLKEFGFTEKEINKAKIIKDDN